MNADPQRTADIAALSRAQIAAIQKDVAILLQGL